MAQLHRNIFLAPAFEAGISLDTLVDISLLILLAGSLRDLCCSEGHLEASSTDTVFHLLESYPPVVFSALFQTLGYSKAVWALLHRPAPRRDSLHHSGPWVHRSGTTEDLILLVL